MCLSWNNIHICFYFTCPLRCLRVPPGVRVPQVELNTTDLMHWRYHSQWKNVTSVNSPSRNGCANSDMPSLNKQEVLGRTNRILSLIRHGPHWKWNVQQFFYCCVCIRYRGNVSIEPLPCNDRGIFTELMPSNDKGIFTQPLFSNEKGIHRQTNTHTAMWSHKPTFIFSK
jgi:hypothetical protein